jgi:hypothetical protein
MGKLLLIRIVDHLSFFAHHGASTPGYSLLITASEPRCSAEVDSRGSIGVALPPVSEKPQVIDPRTSNLLAFTTPKLETKYFEPLDVLGGKLGESQRTFWPFGAPLVFPRTGLGSVGLPTCLL